MKIVIDTNRLIAALVKAGVTREIIHSNKIEFVTPEGAIEEIIKHKSIIAKKAGISENEIESLYAAILFYVHIIPSKIIKTSLSKAKQIMKNIDIDDAIFVACALSTKADGIFSEDKHFNRQNVVKVYNTNEILKFIQKAS